MDLHPGRPLRPEEIVELLQEARARTLLLVAPLDDADLRLQHDPLMSPIVWDLGHIAHFEEVWLLRNVDGPGPGSEGLEGIYDPFRNPRATRAGLDLPGRADLHPWMARIRRAVLDNLSRLDLSTSTSPLLADGFVFRMVLQHEYQHGETILQTLQLKQGAPYPAPRASTHPTPSAPPPAPPAFACDDPGMVRFPGGAVTIGTDDASDTYDNERPAHVVELPPFRIDRTPVTEADVLAFIADGGYERDELWDEAGRTWIREQGIRAPKYWFERDGAWWTRVMDLERPIDADRPVAHLCWYEADAYARWIGKRLPTEFEWEAAARFDPSTGLSRRFPWGDAPAGPDRANVDSLAFDTAPVWSFAGNVSPIGCYGMIGDVWEWTSSRFDGYPGYRTFPYPEYSEVFFGDEYRVLRGGSWATRSGAIRSTFRNWDYPIRRQIFAGLRCAADD